MKLIFKLLPPVLIAVAQLSGAALAQTKGAAVAPDPGMAQSPSMSTKASDKSNPLVRGAEIFETLTEAAPALEATAFKKSLSEFEALYPEISLLLRADAKRRLDSLVTGVRTAWRKADRGALAIESIEIYRLLQESVDYRGQPVPVEVPMLDYAGFKLKALLLSARPNWKQVGKTAQEASAWWAAIESRVTDKSLREAMAHTSAGIKDGAVRKEVKLLRFTAEMDLILVDGLEAFFNSRPAAR